MANLITTHFTMGSIGSFTGNLQAFANTIAAGLTCAVELDSKVLVGQLAGSEPVSDIGLWYPPITGSTTFPSGIAYAWSANDGKYLPVPLVAGQLRRVSGSADVVYLTQLQATCTANRKQYLQDKDGTVALTSDISTGIGIETLTSGATMTLDWTNNKEKFVTLGASTTVSLIGTPQESQWMDIWFENNITAYTVTWGNTILWPAATAPTMTTASAGQRRISHVRLYSLGKPPGNTIYGEYTLNYQAATAGAATPTVTDVTVYGYNILLTFSEPIRGGALTASNFVAKLTVSGTPTAQTIVSASASGSVATVQLSNPATSADIWTIAYTAGGSTPYLGYLVSLAGVPIATFGDTAAAYTNTGSGTPGTGGHLEP